MNLTDEEIEEFKEMFKEKYIPAISGPGITVGINNYTMDKVLTYLGKLKTKWSKHITEVAWKK